MYNPVNMKVDDE